jgi:VIT1/CCC1 family predicted Fe2+/Mn2+ transporter
LFSRRLHLVEETAYCDRSDRSTSDKERISGVTTSASMTDRQRYQQNLQGEVDGAALYRLLADAESTPELAEVYRRLAAVEDRHAELWRSKLREDGAAIPALDPTFRIRLIGWLARRFGASAVVPLVMAGEAGDSALYHTQPEARQAGLDADERSHARVFRAISMSMPHGMPGEALARMEGRHRATGGNALRAAVLGVNDGLVSNLSLVMGVAGASLQQSAILLTGLAGLLAGAISMALGEWLSVQSSRELYERQIAIERQELEAAPDEEREELALIYQAKGIPAQRARELAAGLIADPRTALDTLAREELGINPESLGGSAWVAAATSFALFAIGALIPVLPYLLIGGIAAAVVSGVITAAALFASGALGSLLTGQPVLKTGLRQTALGLLAALVTFSLGKLVGAGLGL